MQADAEPKSTSDPLVTDAIKTNTSGAIAEGASRCRSELAQFRGGYSDGGRGWAH